MAPTASDDTDTLLELAAAWADAQGRPLNDAEKAFVAACAEPGAPVVYAVCSLQPEEGPEVVASVLAAGAPVTRERIDPQEIGGLADLIDREGALRTLPCHLAEQGGLDGFYACRLRKRLESG